MKTKQKSLTDLSTFDIMLKDAPISQGKKDIKFRTNRFPEARSYAIKHQINKDYNG